MDINFFNLFNDYNIKYSYFIRLLFLNNLIKKSIKFEGEYLNGENNGKGKEYYQNHILKFEGEYLN